MHVIIQVESISSRQVEKTLQMRRHLMEFTTDLRVHPIATLVNAKRDVQGTQSWLSPERSWSYQGDDVCSQICTGLCAP